MRSWSQVSTFWPAVWARVYSSLLSRMCEVGEDLGAGGGGVVEQGQEEMVGADFFVPE
ncbi:hypothetical protein SAMN04490220_0690 [Rhodococcus jostii]|uniref:Uncharacterized protein n=1 Tax=Rhodococcus jostii TaxID=132919 RepID=A0A1H4J7H8_RHOJO|nr:hypothetical protein SAMN04490220_0690 [Rhodococcus jostii]